MGSGSANFTTQVDNVFLFVLAISVALLLFITFLMIFFVFKYHRKRNKVAQNIHGNVVLELVWTIVPIVLVMGMFYYGMIAFRNMKNVPPDAMGVDVRAQMWSWHFTYDNGVQTDTLYVPVGKPVQLILTSQDVIHSFFIPAFRIKQDAVPGQSFVLWFEAQKPGDYQVFCAEYCGLRHSFMLTKVIAMPEEEFQVWYAGATAGMAVAPPPSKEEPGTEETIKKAAMGKMIVQNRGCVACHTLDGSKLVGPTFKGLFGRKEIIIVDGQEKEIIVDEDYVRRSIVEPNAEVVKGFQPLMPPFKGVLSEDEIQGIIQYLKENK